MSKIAIVTGVSGKLGKALVKKFLDENYKVIGTVSQIANLCPMLILKVGYNQQISLM